MTAEQLKSKIGFKTRKDDFGNTIITGGLILTSEVRVHTHDKHFDQMLRKAEDLIRENIAREVYGWQQEEFRDALHEYMVMHHAMGDYIAANAAHERLLKAARYQEASQEKEGR